MTSYFIIGFVILIVIVMGGGEVKSLVSKYCWDKFPGGKTWVYIASMKIAVLVAAIVIWPVLLVLALIKFFK